jgi:hypothetical protein
MYVQMLRRQLIESDTSELITGWRRNDLRNRLERFATSGIKEQVLGNYVARQKLVHSEFGKSIANYVIGIPSPLTTQ